MEAMTSIHGQHAVILGESALADLKSTGDIPTAVIIARNHDFSPWGGHRGSLLLRVRAAHTCFQHVIVFDEKNCETVDSCARHFLRRASSEGNNFFQSYGEEERDREKGVSAKAFPAKNNKVYPGYVSKLSLLPWQKKEFQLYET